MVVHGREHDYKASDIPVQSSDRGCLGLLKGNQSSNEGEVSTDHDGSLTYRVLMTWPNWLTFAFCDIGRRSRGSQSLDGLKTWRCYKGRVYELIEGRPSLFPRAEESARFQSVQTIQTVGPG